MGANVNLSSRLHSAYFGQRCIKTLFVMTCKYNAEITGAFDRIREGGVGSTDSRQINSGNGSSPS